MSKSSHASRMEALRLNNRLKRLKSNWSSEPILRELPPHLISEMQVISEKMDVACNPILLGLGLFGSIGFYLLGMFADWSMLIFWCCIMAALVGEYCWFGHHRKYAVYALTQVNNIDVLPTLIKATTHKWGRDAAVIAAIHRLLKKVTETDSGLLNREAQETLWNMAVLPLTLRNNADEAFAFSALQALARIGDRETLTAMQRIANHSAMYPAEHRLHQRTRELVPLMEARLQRQEVPQTLLRASGVPYTTPDTLLRAYAAPSPKPPQQLLRASASEAGKAED